MRDPASKILARDELVRALRVGAPDRVVLANGLFDLLHVGHARYLADARRAGDFLVVALNDDASSRANKGPGRPLVPLEQRMLVVAALRSVDAVTWFGEPTLAETLRAIRPSVHAKGTDYRPESLPAPERAVHAELGIDVVIVGDPKNHATRDLIEIVTRDRTDPDGR
ncbi:MAG: adenylyltransferase/cytidyltransferase family protein [Acidobacteriota bacterium]|nr:adenylyltransferase/cytidyltransferase family protein [Acidobacteriota bacterium]